MTKTPPLSGNTTVTVALTSEANDQLSEFDLVLQSVTLNSQSGKTANLVLGAPGIRIHPPQRSN